MPNSECIVLPTPDLSSIIGEAIAPAERTTSFLALARFGVVSLLCLVGFGVTPDSNSLFGV